MAQDHSDWPFAWPPRPGNSVALWLAELPSNALASVAAKVDASSDSTPCDTEIDSGDDQCGGHRQLCYSSSHQVVSLRCLPGKNGAVVTVSAVQRKASGPLVDFESIRYPAVLTLSALFVALLPIADDRSPEIWRIYRACVWMLSITATGLWTVWLKDYLQERKRMPEPDDTPQLLDGLGHAFKELGARPVPPDESPFRR